MFMYLYFRFQQFWVFMKAKLCRRVLLIELILSLSEPQVFCLKNGLFVIQIKASVSRSSIIKYIFFALITNNCLAAA